MAKWYVVKGKENIASYLFTESGCLSDNGFALYVGGEVNDSEARALEKHLAQCPECLEMLGDIMHVLSAEPTEEEKELCKTTPEDVARYMEFLKPYLGKPTLKHRVRPWLAPIFQVVTSPRFAYALALVLAVALASILWMRSSAPREHERLYAQGVESLKSVSRFEAASGLRFISALATPRERHAQGEPQADVSVLDNATAYFFQALGANPKSIPALVGLGQIFLVKGQPAEAEKRFQAALALDRDHQEVLNGLGMALFDRARAESDLYTKDHLLKASSDAFAKILAKDPGRMEVLYNQALTCYELGDNKSKTLDLIEQYLARDFQSKWAKELSLIRDKLRLSSYEIFDKEVEDAVKQGQLDRLAQLVSSSPHAAWLIRTSLIVSLKLEVEGDVHGARQAFGIAEAVEKAYRQFIGDAHYGQLIDFYNKLSDQQKQQKYRADRMAKEALIYYQYGNEDASLASSAQALVIYQQLHDYWQEALMHVLRGDCYFYRRSEYDRALVAYQATLLVAEHSRDLDVRAWAYGNIGVIYLARGNYYDMRTYFDRMLVLAEQLKNPARQAFALNYFGNLYRELGDWKESIRYYSKALILNRRVGDQYGQLQNLKHIGFLYQRSKEYYKSIDFL